MLDPRSPASLPSVFDGATAAAAREGLGPRTCALVLDAIRPLLPFDLATVWVRDESGFKPGASFGRPFDLLEEMPFSFGRGLRAWIAEKGRPILIPSSSRGFRNETLRGFVAVPVRASAQTSATIELGRIEEIFTAADRDLLVEIAGVLAPAFERGRFVGTGKAS